jgi:SAM-dependent methyltransferase
VGPSESEVANPSRWDRFARRNRPSNLIARLFLHDVVYRACARLLRVAVFEGPISVLELGCGTGYVARRIAGRYGAERLVAVDSNPSMMDIARQTLQGVGCAVEFVEADCFQIGLLGQFDLVYSNGLVEHFDDARRARLLQIHADHVRGGGYCIVHAPAPSLSYRFFRGASERLGLWEHHDETPLPLQQLVQEVRQTGLDVLQVGYFWRAYLTEAGVIARKSPRRN